MGYNLCSLFWKHELYWCKIMLAYHYASIGSPSKIFCCIFSLCRNFIFIFRWGKTLFCWSTPIKESLYCTQHCFHSTNFRKWYPLFSSCDLVHTSNLCYCRLLPYNSNDVCILLTVISRYVIGKMRGSISIIIDFSYLILSGWYRLVISIHNHGCFGILIIIIINVKC